MATHEADQVDENEFLKDIDVQSIADEGTKIRWKTADVDHFFGPSIGTEGCRHCKVAGCRYVTSFYLCLILQGNNSHLAGVSLFPRSQPYDTICRPVIK